MNVQQGIQTQYLSAFKMLKEATVKCPPSVWDAPQDKDKFWNKAHHVLFWAHWDLRAIRKDFVPWKGRYKPKAEMPRSKPELLETLAFIEQQVDGPHPAAGRDASSGSVDSARRSWNEGWRTSGISSSTRVSYMKDSAAVRASGFAGLNMCAGEANEHANSGSIAISSGAQDAEGSHS